MTEIEQCEMFNLSLFCFPCPEIKPQFNFSVNEAIRQSQLTGKWIVISLNFDPGNHWPRVLGKFMFTETFFQQVVASNTQEKCKYLLSCIRCSHTILPCLGYTLNTFIIVLHHVSHERNQIFRKSYLQLCIYVNQNQDASH